MTGALAGKRILIVEDEYFIATDLARLLREAGATIIGPVGDLEQGLSLASEHKLDAAVLDVNLEGAQSYAIADRLTEQDVPYLFLTGYDEAAMPESRRSTPRVGKPFPIDKVISTVGQLMERAA